MNTKQKKSLYESIMKSVAKTVKKALNESNGFPKTITTNVLKRYIINAYSLDSTDKNIQKIARLFLDRHSEYDQYEAFEDEYEDICIEFEDFYDNVLNNPQYWNEL